MDYRAKEQRPQEPTIEVRQPGCWASGLTWDYICTDSRSHFTEGKAGAEDEPKRITHRQNREPWRQPIDQRGGAQGSRELKGRQRWEKAGTQPAKITGDLSVSLARKWPRGVAWRRGNW